MSNLLLVQRHTEGVVSVLNFDELKHLVIAKNGDSKSKEDAWSLIASYGDDYPVLESFQDMDKAMTAMEMVVDAFNSNASSMVFHKDGNADFVMKGGE